MNRQQRRTVARRQGRAPSSPEAGDLLGVVDAVRAAATPDEFVAWGYQNVALELHAAIRAVIEAPEVGLSANQVEAAKQVAGRYLDRWLADHDAHPMTTGAE